MERKALLRREAVVAIYDRYNQMSNPLVVQNEYGSWEDLTIGDLIDIISEGVARHDVARHDA